MHRFSLSIPLSFRVPLLIALIVPLWALPGASPAYAMEVTDRPTNGAVIVLEGTDTAGIFVDKDESEVVRIAARMFAEDVERVGDHRPTLVTDTSDSAQLIIAGTLEGSPALRSLANRGLLKDLDTIKGHWEATLTQVVESPFPNVERALVIVGSDRRGAAYGLMRLSEKIGVSPWYWWADVPVSEHETIALTMSGPELEEPGVKYRGIFINDEDWGMHEWSAKTFEPEFGNIGPKTYERVYQLMLRLRLNYLWPAMHACSKEFSEIPEAVAMANDYAIVAGASHCEPMLCNNIHWDESTQGRWNYSLNRDAIHSYWEQNVEERGANEAVWTIGIRGIHDQGMQRPPDGLQERIDLMNEVFHDQRELLDEHVTEQWGPVAQAFVPYKEVLPIYDAGLEVPEDVTLVWVDDNFGYIRRLSSPEERERSGGAGVYWHLSYYGGPHSYTWLNTTSPALMWEELHKAWENDARTIWMLNVGDIKPMEIGVDYFAHLSWNPDGFPLGAQREYLEEFAASCFGKKVAQPVSDLLMDYYRLGAVRKPELMQRCWALSLNPAEAEQLEKDYQALLEQEQKVRERVPADALDAYIEMVGFPAQILAMSGQVFMADRRVIEGREVASNEEKIKRLRSEMEAQVKQFNDELAGGKWKHMMPGLVTAKDITAWNSQVRWPWGEKEDAPVELLESPRFPASKDSRWISAAKGEVSTPDSSGDWRWAEINGLGPTGSAMALLPVTLEGQWAPGAADAPSLEFSFRSKEGEPTVWIDFIPTFRLYPSMKQRVALTVDDGEPIVVEVPGSSGKENEYGAVRSNAVQDNYARAAVQLPALPAGAHTLRLQAVDPGVVVSQLNLPVIKN